MVLEFVEAVPPHLAVRLEPSVELDQRLHPDPVETALALRSDGDQAGVAKHPEMLRYRRLADRQALDQSANGPLPGPQLVEDQSPAGLGNDLDGRLSGHEEKYYP